MPDDKSLRQMDSQETLASLLQLDPSPIETPPADEMDTEKELPALPKESVESSYGSLPASSVSGATTSAPGLSGGHHGAIFYLTRIQKYSSYAVSLFTGLHLANVSLIPAVTRSVAGSETYLLMTREIYQTSITEPLLVGLPVLAHIGSGIALRLVRRSQNKRRYGGYGPDASGVEKTGTHTVMSFWPPLSYISISGYAFTVFFSAHVFMNRVLPLAVEGDSSNVGLAYVAHGFARHPLLAGLAYGGLIFVGVGHMVWGAARWLGIAPSSRGLLVGDSKVFTDKPALKRRRRKWLQVSGAALAASTLWAVGGMGVVANGGLADGWVGKLYDDLFARVGLSS